jgi:multiple sugar transport system substrate-binding protein
MNASIPLDRRRLLHRAAALTAIMIPSEVRRAAAADVAITYWHHFTSQTEFAGLERVVRLFEARHPAVAVTPETIPNAEFMAKIVAAIVSGSPPDTTMITAERFPDLKAIDGLRDITERIQAWPTRTSFSPRAFDAVTSDGRVYGIPALTFVDWTYYRRDWFEEAGIDQPPDTMEAFLAAALKLTDRERGRYGFGLRGGDGGHGSLLNLIRAWGSPLVEDGKVAIDRPKAIDAVRFYAELYTRHHVVPPSAPGDSYRQIMEGFRTGQTGMIWHHTGSLREIATALPADSFMTAVLPAGPAARIATVSYLYNGLMSGEKADASFAWVSFWGEAAPALAMLEETGYFPASREVAADPRVTGNSLYRAAARTLEFGVPPPSFPGADSWGRSIVMPEFQRILIGDRSVEDAVDSMIAGLEKTLP